MRRDKTFRGGFRLHFLLMGAIVLAFVVIFLILWSPW
jgi:hypothetical protein